MSRLIKRLKNEPTAKNDELSGQNPPPAAEEKEKSSEDILRETAQDLTMVMEKMRIAEYVQYLERPWKLLWTNFLIGIARGLGSTIGLAIILAILFFVLQHIVMLNLPFISDLLTKMIYTVQENLRYFNGSTF